MSCRKMNYLARISFKILVRNAFFSTGAGSFCSIQVSPVFQRNGLGSLTSVDKSLIDCLPVDTSWAGTRSRRRRRPFCLGGRRRAAGLSGCGSGPATCPSPSAHTPRSWPVSPPSPASAAAASPSTTHRHTLAQHRNRNKRAEVN